MRVKKPKIDDEEKVARLDRKYDVLKNKYIDLILKDFAEEPAAAVHFTQFLLLTMVVTLFKLEDVDLKAALEMNNKMFQNFDQNIRSLYSRAGLE